MFELVEAGTRVVVMGVGEGGGHVCWHVYDGTIAVGNFFLLHCRMESKAVEGGQPRVKRVLCMVYL